MDMGMYVYIYVFINKYIYKTSLECFHENKYENNNVKLIFSFNSLIFFFLWILFAFYLSLIINISIYISMDIKIDTTADQNEKLNK